MAINYFNFKIVSDSFYLNSKANFSSISKERLEYLINNSKELNKLYNDENFEFSKRIRYSKLMSIINSLSRKDSSFKNKFVTNSNAEKFTLFMLSVDPNFEMLIIYLSEDKYMEIKKKMYEKFDLYDPNLIKIEKQVFKLLDEKRKQEIKEEAEKRAFK